MPSVIDAAGMIALPRLQIDSHRHTWQSLLRSTAAGLDPGAVFLRHPRRHGQALHARRHVTSPTILGALEALDAGITTLYDWSHNNNTPDHADEAVRAAERTPASAPSTATAMPSDEWVPVSKLPRTSPTSSACVRTHFSSDDQLVTMAFAAPWSAIHHPRHYRGRFPPLARPRPAAHRPCRRRPLGHERADRAAGEPRPARRRRHLRPLQHALGARFPPHRRQRRHRLAVAGGRAADGPRLPATMKLLAVGVRPRPLHRHRHLHRRRHVQLHARASHRHARGRERRGPAQGRIVDPLPLTTRDVLEFATIQGARACGLAGQDRLADAGQAGRRHPRRHQQPEPVPAQQCLQRHRRGRPCRQRRFGASSPARRASAAASCSASTSKPLRAKVDAARDALFARAGVPADGSWLPRPYEAP